MLQDDPPRAPEPRVAGSYEPDEGWIAPCPGSPYLLVDYRNLHIRVQVRDEYAVRIDAFQPKVLATFRYGMSADFTGVTGSVADMRIARSPNIFVDEPAARAAIQVFKDAKAARENGPEPSASSTKKTSQYRAVRGQPKSEG